MKRTASADAIFQVFDDKISKYLDRNRKAIEDEYRKKSGRPVSDSDLSSFMSGLGDVIYDRLELDPAHLARFADFYLSDDKLSKMVAGLVDASSEYPRAASSPEEISSRLRALAGEIILSLKRGGPEKKFVTSSIRRLLAGMGEDSELIFMNIYFPAGVNETEAIRRGLALVPCKVGRFEKETSGPDYVAGNVECEAGFYEANPDGDEYGPDDAGVTVYWETP